MWFPPGMPQRFLEAEGVDEDFQRAPSHACGNFPAEQAGFTPLREPRRAQLSIALELSSTDDLAIIHKTSIFYAADGGLLASVERALVDLHYEVTRERYALDAAEMMSGYYYTLTSVSLEYPKMLRYAGLRRFRSDIEWVL